MRDVRRSEIVEKGYLLLIEFENCGNVPIERKDYETPLIIKFTKQVEILNAGVINVYPNDISPEIEIFENQIKINPLLLNPNDKFMIKAIVNQFDDKFSVSGRIVGVKTIQMDHKAKLKNSKFYLFWGYTILVIGSLFPKFEFSIIGGALHYDSSVYRGMLIAIGAVIFFYGLMPVNYWQNFIDKRQPRNKKN